MCCLQWLAILAFLFIKVLSAPERDVVDSLPGQPAVTFKQYAGYVTVNEKRDRALFYYFVEAETDPDLKPLVVWLNGEANMLYLESPAGVGFSYSNDPSYYKGANDTKTAIDNLLFLHGWFKKFPEYKTRELYLTGESYAGHYIPQLAELIVKENRKQMIFNLKGIAIGNPLLDFTTDLNARAEYLWSHGLVSDSAYNMMKSGCNYSRFQDEYFQGSVSSTCEQIYLIVSMEISKYVNNYDVTSDSCLSSLLMQKSKMMLGVEMIGTTTVKPDVCVQDEATAYLNMPNVQKAFHARLVGSVKRWEACNDVLQYDHFNFKIPTGLLLAKLVRDDIRVLIYSGDQDSIIPLTGTRTLVNNLAASLKLKTTVPYSVWFQGKQVAGWVQVYGNLLSFATVKGAGHEVPFSQPERSLVLFKAFLKGQPPPSIMV